MKAECHEHLTRPGVKYNEEMNISVFAGKWPENDGKPISCLCDKICWECVLYVDLNEFISAKGTIFFMNEKAIEEPGQTFAPLYSIVI